jgi:demethylmenaquinone methyltransferase/2-methoxy-6-polyprenyl-1,4-benzoquinol methylase
MDSRRPERTAEPVPPHPTLAGYYGRDEDRPEFVRHLFDRAATDYDRIEGSMALGWGRRYRREALARAGLFEGMRVLDVAIGTGLVGREAVRLAGDTSRVIGLDPSAGMLAEARRHLGVGGVLGIGERVPFREGSFDFLSMGYALRHLSDLAEALREFRRVLRPGGALCILELTRPQNRLGYAALRFYLRHLVPVFTRLRTHNPEAELLMRYFWDTIEACVLPERILGAMDDAGFVEVRRTLVIGLFSEYTGFKEGPRPTPPGPPRKPERSDFFVRRMDR